jgi:hypothetical protein
MKEPKLKEITVSIFLRQKMFLPALVSFRRRK